MDDSLLVEILQPAQHLRDVDDEQALWKLAELLHRVMKVTSFHISDRHNHEDDDDDAGELMKHGKSVMKWMDLLEDEVEVLGRVLVVDELDDVHVVQILQQLELLLMMHIIISPPPSEAEEEEGEEALVYHDLGHLVFAYELLLDLLDGHHLARFDVQTSKHRAEGALPQRVTDLLDINNMKMKKTNKMKKMKKSDRERHEVYARCGDVRRCP